MIMFLMFLVEVVSWDVEVIECLVRIMVVEVIFVWVYWILFFVVNVLRDVCWGYLVRGLGEDFYLVSLIVVVKIKGF